MTEEGYSPLTPREIQTAIQRHISSIPEPRSWELFPQKPDGFYYGTATEEHFYLALAAGSEKGNPIVEILGSVTPLGAPNQRGCLVALKYRPGQANTMAWLLMLLFFIGFLTLVLLNYKTRGNLSAIIILPALGLLGLLIFGAVYKSEVSKSRRFLWGELQLQKKLL
jgi:hypothetical protein